MGILIIASINRKCSHNSKKLTKTLIKPALFKRALAKLTPKNKKTAISSCLVTKIWERSLTRVLNRANMHSQGITNKCSWLTIDGNFSSVRTRG